MTQSNTIATEILKQLGGGKFIAMTGATCYKDGENSLMARFKGSKVANHLRVTLTADDLYEVTFSQVRGANVKIVEKFQGVYNDMLIPIFEQTTKLYVSL